MKDEYDFSHGQRGRYAARFAEGSNIVVLDPDVAALFPTAAEVNRALRAFAEAAPQHGDRESPPKKDSGGP